MLTVAAGTATPSKGVEAASGVPDADSRLPLVTVAAPEALHSPLEEAAGATAGEWESASPRKAVVASEGWT